MRHALLASLLLLSSCSGAALRANEATTSPSPTAMPRETEEKAPHVFPAPGTDIPRSADRVARAITLVQKALPPLIEEWLRRDGRRRSPLGREVQRGALYQQKLYRGVVAEERRERRVMARLSSRHAHILRRHVRIQERLSALVTPVKPGSIKWKTYRPASPHRLLDFYRKGERRFDVPWEVLAAVNAVETRFGRILGPSSAGALGPMQFMPATWEQYGAGGDIMDPHDSIIAAARYLSASGAPERMDDALFAYNRSNHYVDAILGYANQIMRDPRYYYTYYFWEVFLRTTKGDVQYTGPGRDR